MTSAIRFRDRDLPAYALCFVAGIALNMLSGNSKRLGFPIGPDRILFGIGLLLFFLDPVARKPLRLRLRPVHPAAIGLLALAAFSGLEHNTITTSLGFYAWLDRLAVPFMMFALAPIVFRTPERRDLLLRVLVCMGLYLGATAIFEMVGPHALVFPRFIMDPNVGIQFGRARGPFTESEADGLAMCQCGFAAAFAVFRLPGRWRYVSIATVGLCAIGILLTLTRSVWIGTALGVVVVCLLTPVLRKYLLPLAAAFAVVIVVALAVLPGVRGSADARAGTVRSVWDRQNTDAAAIRIVEEHPLAGVGWLRFLFVNQNYVRQARGYPITNIGIEVHNVTLGRAAELGLPGAVLWIFAVLAGPCLVFIRRKPGGDLNGWAIVSMGGTSCWLIAINLSPVPYPLPNLLVWLLAGLALSPYLTTPRTPELTPPPARKRLEASPV